MKKKKQYRAFLANLGIEVPVHKYDSKTSQVEILMSDIPVEVARKAALPKNVRTVKYWVGENAGGNRLIEEGGETEEERKSREFVEATAQAIVDLANGVSKLLNGRLRKDAVVLLLQEAVGGRSVISKELVNRILEVCASLDKRWLK